MTMRPAKHHSNNAPVRPQFRTPSVSQMHTQANRVQSMWRKGLINPRKSWRSCNTRIGRIRIGRPVTQEAARSSREHSMSPETATAPICPTSKTFCIQRARIADVLGSGKTFRLVSLSTCFNILLNRTQWASACSDFDSPRPLPLKNGASIETASCAASTSAAFATGAVPSIR